MAMMETAWPMRPQVAYHWSLNSDIAMPTLLISSCATSDSFDQLFCHSQLFWSILLLPLLFWSIMILQPQAVHLLNPPSLVEGVLGLVGGKWPRRKMKTWGIFHPKMVTFIQVKSLQKEKMRQRMVVHKVDFIPFAIYQKIKKGVLPQKKDTPWNWPSCYL